MTSGILSLISVPPGDDLSQFPKKPQTFQQPEKEVGKHVKCVSGEGPWRPSRPLLSIIAAGKSGSKTRSKWLMNVSAQRPLVEHLR